MSPVEVMWEWDGPEREMARTRRPKETGEDAFAGDVEGPLPRPPQLWRDHGKISGSDGGIHVVVCCCNEDDEELKVMLGSFRHEGELPCPVRVSFILDRHHDGDFGEHHGETYQALRQLLPVLSVGDKNAEEKREIGSEGFGEFGCVSHPGVLSNTSVPFDLYVKGPSLPQGKRNSLVLFFEEILPTKITRGEADEPDAVYILDADSGHPDNGLPDLIRMWKLLMSEIETAAITCPVRPVNLLESVLACSQGLEYAQVWDFVGESYFAAQTTCRSAPCMFKYSCLIEDGRGALPPCGEGAQVPVLAALSYTAACLPAMILLDTSPCEGILVLLRQRGYDLRSCGVAEAVTCVPNSLWEFYAQRRRWYAATITAVLSHLTGREHYFQHERGRGILSIYVAIFNVYLHTGVLFLPVMLTKGVALIVAHIDGRIGVEGYGEWQGYYDFREPTLEWCVFGLIWIFLCLNTFLFTLKSHRQLWMWINISSVGWMLFCAIVLMGVSSVVTPWIAVVVLLAPVIVGGLNVAGFSLIYWAYLAVAAVPFALMTSVHSVLIFLFAVGTLDSTEWGTRDVGSFDSGVTKHRAREMRRRTTKLVWGLIAASIGLGAVMVRFSSYTVIPIAIALASFANFLKVVVSVLPGKLERIRQRSILGQTELQRPRSLRRSRAELAPANACSLDPRPSGRVRLSRKNVGSACSTDTGSFGTIEDGLVPSPDETRTFPFGLDDNTSREKSGESVDGTVTMTPPRKLPAPEVPGHKRSHSQTSRRSTRSPSSGRVDGSGSLDDTFVEDSNDAHAADETSSDSKLGVKSSKSRMGAAREKSSPGKLLRSASSPLPLPQLGSGSSGFSGLFNMRGFFASFISDGNGDSNCSNARDANKAGGGSENQVPVASPPKGMAAGMAKAAARTVGEAAAIIPMKIKFTSRDDAQAQGGTDGAAGEKVSTGRRTTTFRTMGTLLPSPPSTVAPFCPPPTVTHGSANTSINMNPSQSSKDGGNSGTAFAPEACTAAPAPAAETPEEKNNASGGIAPGADGEAKGKSAVGVRSTLPTKDSFAALLGDGNSTGRPPSFPRRGNRASVSLANVVKNMTPATTSTAPNITIATNSSPNAPAGKRRPWGQRPSSVDSQESISPERLAAINARRNSRTSVTGRLGWSFGLESPEDASAGTYGNRQERVRSSLEGVRRSWGLGTSSDSFDDTQVYGTSAPKSDGRGSLVGSRRNWPLAQDSLDSQDDIPSPGVAAFDRGGGARGSLVGIRRAWGFMNSMDSEDGMDAPTPTYGNGRNFGSHGGDSLIGIRSTWGGDSAMSEEESAMNERAVAEYMARTSHSSDGTHPDMEHGEPSFAPAWGSLGPMENYENDQFTAPMGVTGRRHSNQGRQPFARLGASPRLGLSRASTGTFVAPSARAAQSQRFGTETRVAASPRVGSAPITGRSSRRASRSRRATLPTLSEPRKEQSSRPSWGSEQLDVFETSGSSSEDERKPRGLHGVRVLDPGTAEKKRPRKDGRRVGVSTDSPVAMSNSYGQRTSTGPPRGSGYLGSAAENQLHIPRRARESSHGSAGVMNNGRMSRSDQLTPNDPTSRTGRRASHREMQSGDDAYTLEQQ